MDRGTVTIYNVTASNDDLVDWCIDMVVAVDIDNAQVIDGDIRYDSLERRLRRDGWLIKEAE